MSSWPARRSASIAGRAASRMSIADAGIAPREAGEMLRQEIAGDGVGDADPHLARDRRGGGRWGCGALR